MQTTPTLASFAKLAALVVTTGLLTAAAEQPAATLTHVRTQPEYRTDRIVVALRQTPIGATASSATAKLQLKHELKLQAEDRFSKLIKTKRNSSFKVLNPDDDSSLAAITLAPGQSVAAAMRDYALNPDVASVQPDYIYRKSATVPNDTSYSKLWGLKNSAQTMTQDHPTQFLYTTANPGTSARDMGLETAWDKQTDCSNVIVAVIDTGIRLDHEDLVDNLWSDTNTDHGYDFVNNDNNPNDDEGHGTHVAGTIGARGNNAKGTAGVCWRVKLMAVKVLDESGSGSTSTIISGVNYARTKGAHVINMSLGGGGLDAGFQAAVEAASQAGILIVVAAGNDGTNNGSIPTYPCNFPATNLICIGAVDQSFARASFSNYSTLYVDIGAPGTNIFSTALGPFSTTTLSLAAADWTLNSAGFGFVVGPPAALQNPANWNGTTNMYSANANDQAYTAVDLTGTANATLIMSLRAGIQSGIDFLDIWAYAGSGDPLLSGSLVDILTGTTNGALVTTTTNLVACADSPCSIGFNFTSDATTQSTGVKIESLEVEKQLNTADGYDSLNGTSMATPHVAGLAALVKALNPAFTAADIKNAILTTGTKNSGLTAFFAKGSVVSAPGALKYIPTPVGVTSSIVTDAN